MRRALNKLAESLLMALGLSPLWVLIAARWLPDLAAFGLPWAALCALSALPAALWGGRRRMAVALPGFALLALLLALRAHALHRPAMAALLAPCALLFYKALRAAPLPAWRQRDAGFWYAALALHALSQLAARLAGLRAALPVLTVLLAAYVAALPLVLNRQALEENATGQAGDGPARYLRLRNLLLALGFSTLTLLAGTWNAVKDAFSVLLGWMGRGLLAVVLWLGRLFAADASVAPAYGGEAFLPMAAEAGEASAFWAVLEKIGIAAALLLGAAGLCFALWKLAGLCRQWLRRLHARLRETFAALSEENQVEKESILDWEEMRRSARARAARLRRRLTRPPRWEQMDNRRRVRWAYARLRAQRPDIADAQTAREALSRIPEGARMADVYDAARYGLRDITDEEAAFMRTAVQRRP